MPFGRVRDPRNRVVQGPVDVGIGLQAARQVGGTDEDHVDAFDRRDGVHVPQAFHGLDLAHDEGLPVRVLEIGRTLIPHFDTEIAVDPGAVDAPVAQGRELRAIDDVARDIRRGHEGDHEPGGAVFQVPVQPGPFQGRRAHHAVDVVLPAHGQDRLHFPGIHGPVFQVEPQPVELEVGGVADVERQVMAEAGHPDEAGGTKLGEHLALAHAGSFRDDSAGCGTL